MSSSEPLSFKDDPDSLPPAESGPPPDSSLFFICPKCSRAIAAGRVSTGTPLRCAKCGTWIPVPSGELKGAQTSGPRYVCPTCRRIGVIAAGSEGLVFSCVPCSKSIKIREDLPEPPPAPVKERFKQHVKSLAPIVKHDMSELRLPREKRCAERFAADPGFRDSHYMCPECRHGSPKDAARCGFCGMNFGGANAAVVEEFNLDLSDEIRAGLATRGRFFTPGLAVIGVGSLIGLIGFLLFTPLSFLPRRPFALS